MKFGTGYLFDASGFPASLGKRPWGTHGVCLDLGGRGYRLEGLTTEQARLLRTRFAAYVSDVAAGIPIVVRTYEADVAAFRPPPPPPSVYALDFDHRNASVGWAGVREAGTMTLSLAPDVCMWTVAGEGDVFARAVENVLRLVVAYSLLEEGGALFHGACVVDGGTATLFPGVSGSGKTTISRLSAAEGRTVLSDDIVGVLPGPAGYDAVALPFGSEFRWPGPRNARFPLGAMYGLEKGEETRVTDLNRSTAFGLGLACTPYVNVDPRRTDQLFAVLDRFTATLRLRSLRFPKDGPVWTTLPEEPLCTT